MNRIATFILVSFAATTIANASDGPVIEEGSSSDSGWNYTIAFPMVWAPDIHGEIGGGDETVSVEIPFSEIVDRLSFGFIGEFYAQKGNWTLALKVNFLDTKDEIITDELNGPIWGGSNRTESSDCHEDENVVQRCAR